MSLTLFRPTAPDRRRRPNRNRVAPTLEGMEERTVMSHMAIAPAMVHPAAHVAPHAALNLNLPINVTGINLTGLTTNAAGLVTGVTGVLTGTLAGHAFTTPITIAPSAATHGGIPVLHLSLAPIHLNLLGLHVDTSAICLDVSAHPGKGNLLGNLVGGLANLLNGGIPASTPGLLGALNGLLLLPVTSHGHAPPTSIIGLVNDALSQTLGQLGTPSVTAAGTTNILHLSVGPLHLNVLGLHVDLDNCANGPITVDVTAETGPGNLLGNLLGDLAGLLTASPLDLAAIRNDLNMVVTDITNAAAV